MAQRDLMLIAREINNGKPKSADVVSAATKIPKWKVSRVLRRLEKHGLVRSSVELRFSIGKPRKLYSVTPEGIRFFEDMGVEIFEPTKAEQKETNTI